jgi:hypothetical protein
MKFPLSVADWLAQLLAAEKAMIPPSLQTAAAAQLQQWQAAMPAPDGKLEAYCRQLMTMLRREWLLEPLDNSVPEAIYADVAPGAAYPINPASLHALLVYRQGDPLVLAFLLAALLESVGLKVECIRHQQQLRLFVQPQNQPDDQAVLSFWPWSTEPLRWIRERELGLVERLDIGRLQGKSWLHACLQQQKTLALLLRQFSDALLLVEAQLQLMPQDFALRRDRGVILQQLGAIEQARADFAFYLTQRPDDPVTLHLQEQLNHAAKERPAVH